MGCASSHEPYVFFIKDAASAAIDEPLVMLRPPSPKASHKPSPSKLRTMSARQASPQIKPLERDGPPRLSLGPAGADSPSKGLTKYPAAKLTSSMMSMSHRIHSPKASSAHSTPFSSEIPSPEAFSLPRTSSRSFPNHGASGFGRSSATTEPGAVRGRAQSHSLTRNDRDCITPIRFAPDDFETKVILGRGGFAWVRLAEHCQTHKFFAIKGVKKAVSSAKHTIADLADEKRALVAMNNLNSPFIVKFYGTYQDAEAVYFVFEYVPGGELFTRLRKVTRFPNDVALFYAAELLLALETVHNAGYAYRDLKPENILIDADGHLKLIDFGFACQASSASQRMFRRVGTANYLAPEMLNKDMKQVGYTRSVDLWAYGCVVYEMLTGKTAFGKPHDPSHGVYLSIIENRLSLPPYVDPHARSLLRSLLTADVSRRMVSFEEVKRHLWFARVDWSAMATKRGLPPFVPTVSGPDDVHNFDTYSKSVDDEPSGGFNRGWRGAGARRPASTEDPPEFNNGDFAVF